MKRFMKMYKIEQKLILRSPDTLMFGVFMPVVILFLIAMINGNKQAGDFDYTYMDSAFSSLLVVGICATAFMSFPLMMADYRDKKILKHFFVTPCNPITLLGADLLCCFISSVISAILVSFSAIVFLGHRMDGNILLFVMSWLLTAISMFSIGMLVASLCRTVKSTNVITSLVYFPMLFLSGATIPYEVFPIGVRKAANVLPLTQGINLMKAVANDIPLDYVVERVVLLLAITVVCTVVSIKTFRWE